MSGFGALAVAAGHSRERLLTEPTADFARPVMARQPMPLKRPYRRNGEPTEVGRFGSFHVTGSEDAYVLKRSFAAEARQATLQPV